MNIALRENRGGTFCDFVVEVGGNVIGLDRGRAMSVVLCLDHKEINVILTEYGRLVVASSVLANRVACSKS